MYGTFPVQRLEEIVGVGIVARRRFWLSCSGAFWSLSRLGRLGVIERRGSGLTRQLGLA